MFLMHTFLYKTASFNVFICNSFYRISRESDLSEILGQYRKELHKKSPEYNQECISLLLQKTGCILLIKKKITILHFQKIVQREHYYNPFKTYLNKITITNDGNKQFFKIFCKTINIPVQNLLCKIPSPQSQMKCIMSLFA